jgi:uncharacterized protein YjiK
MTAPMFRAAARPLPLWMMLVAAACAEAPGTASEKASPDSALLASRGARTAAGQSRSDSAGPGGAPIARWLLPKPLAEISGLALTADGRLLAHNDSHARVFEIDYRRGSIVKQFELAPNPGKVDFEGITVAGASLFLLVSDGTLYEFKEGANGASVPYTKHETGLGRDCEFEGVAYDSTTASLLLACKVVKIQALNDSVVIYRWKVGAGTSAAQRVSRFSVSTAGVALTGGKTINPSDITVDPQSGNYLIVAAREKVLLEITPAGAIVGSQLLVGAHPQAEGIAVTKDRVMIIGNEAAAGPATITLSRRP